MKDLYNFEHRWKLRDWIDESKLDWSYLSSNIRGLYLLEQNKNKINWESLSKNESAIYLLEKNQDKIVWNELGKNRSAITLLKKRIEYENKKNSIMMYVGFIIIFLNFFTNIETYLIDIMLITYLYNFYIHTWKNKCFSTSSRSFCVSLNLNPSALKLLEEYPNKIMWNILSRNPSAIDLLEKNENKINLEMMCLNHGAKRIFDNLLLSEEKLKRMMDKMRLCDWYYLSYNPSAISILERYPDKIRWSGLSKNPSAIHILEKNLEKIDWFELAINPLGMDLLEKNLDKLKECRIDFLYSNPSAMKIIEKIEEKHSESIDWGSLSSNVNAMDLLKKNQDNIYWRTFSGNPSIFELDYDFLKRRMNIIREELMTKTWSPSRYEEWCLHIDFLS